MTLRPTHVHSSGMEAVRAMQTTLRLKPIARLPASTRNRLCFEKRVCAKLTCSISVTDEQNGLMTQASLFDQSSRPAAAAMVTLCGLLLVKEVMESRHGPPHCLSGHVHTAGAPAQFWTAVHVLAVWSFWTTIYIYSGMYTTKTNTSWQEYQKDWFNISSQVQISLFSLSLSIYCCIVVLEANTYTA